MPADLCFSIKQARRMALAAQGFSRRQGPALNKLPRFLLRQAGSPQRSIQRFSASPALAFRQSKTPVPATGRHSSAGRNACDNGPTSHLR
ncbi:hypothetical protein F0170_17530 [Pseudomonas sp. MAFF 730085]|uniref:Uncharacterized protein n=1 Tax=Pseudomonas kitaguniensis TaxID=2607908 RepID=A0A5N7JWB9_9PSED|nr:hypothetical protein [Pseudomonas kitaguniensis]